MWIKLWQSLEIKEFLMCLYVFVKKTAIMFNGDLTTLKTC